MFVDHLLAGNCEASDDRDTNENGKNLSASFAAHKVRVDNLGAPPGGCVRGEIEHEFR